MFETRVVRGLPLSSEGVLEVRRYWNNLPLTSQFKEIIEQGHRALEERDSSRALRVLEVSRELAESLDDQRRLALIMNDPGETTLLSRQAVAIS